METQMVRSRTGLKQKMPDIKRSLEIVRHMKNKHDAGEKEVNTHFLLSDNIWAEGKANNSTGKVGLWLGANVMVEYSFEEAITLLERNFANAESRL